MPSKLLWLKEKLFPIHKHEALKFALLSSICLLVCMNYTILRNLKETLIITNPDLGIEVVPFLRTWMLMPLMLFFVKIYASLSARFNQSRVFYFLILAFLCYFLLFIYVFFPNEESFRLNGISKWLSPLYPPLTKPLGEMIRYWSLSLYYCLSEIWGTMVVLILFWGTSNRLTTMEQARRFYGPMIFITNFSGIISAHASLYISSGSIKWLFFPALSSWDATLSTLTLFVCWSTCVIIILFYSLNRIATEPGSPNETPVSKEEMSLLNIIRAIAKNRKFWPLAVMIAAYFFSTGILELVWKYYLFKVYPESNNFNNFLNYTTFYIGIFSTLIALFATGNMIRRFDWRVSALITPIVLLIPLSALLINGLMGENNSHFLTIGTVAGATYYCLNRICKFTFFDLSKEIACIEFSYTEQIKAKTVLDGIVPKMSKMSESLFLQFMLILFTDFGSIIAPILVVLLGIHLIWAFCIPIQKKHLTTKPIDAHE